MTSEKYYYGDAKKFHRICKIIEKSNIEESEKRFIIDEFEKISISGQNMKSWIERVKSIVNE